ncbi:glycosyltransferase family 4 protein [Methanospirillum hungatei]|jgi:glycosyltransferase involved in cell wall biosynthesis|uniref:glycosyltransferase family 4 protein n=1 Tax=Methanospirillum hungatei TaxID=2203 RepID=UPI001B47D2AA|nr:glycosyltransferase family 4 protein [Methanospirillum hungatei]MBP9007622.1 glycosyltransferase family 4 protein [Methanospirillum sp.]
MKIAFVYDVLYPETIGGVEKRIFEIGTRLAERGHEVHLFPMFDGSDVSIINRDGLIIHPVCRPTGLYTGGRRSVIQALRYSFHLFPVLLKMKVDIIDCQNFPYFPVIVSRLIGFLKKEKCIITWHEAWGAYWYQYLGLSGIGGRVIEKIALLLSSSSIAVSHHTADRMRDEGYYGIPEIIPNGIPLQEIRAINPADRTTDIIFIGRFIPEKHPELVVEAVRVLIRDYHDLTCTMIGDGPMMTRIVEMIHDYGLSENIHLPGFVSDYQEVIRLMKAARVFVLPSEREGFGIVCVEAMACGLPIVTTQYPLNAALDHVLPGCGYCARACADDIATGIRMFLAQSPDVFLLNEYAKNHDWDRITSSVEEIYYRVSNENLRSRKI